MTTPTLPRRPSPSALLRNCRTQLNVWSRTFGRRVRDFLLWAIDMDQPLRIEIIDKLERCEHCGEVGEYGSHQCSEALAGVCLDCGALGAELDRFGLCQVDAGHEITRRWFRWPESRWSR